MVQENEPQPSDDQREEDAHKIIRVVLQDFMAQYHRWIRWIQRTRWLPLVIILLGFLIIIISGIVALVYPSAALPPSVIVTLIGVLIAFIGTLFLFFYKSRMAEALGYFEELESKTSYWKANPAERARLKIQFYMHENLRQVHWIFWLSLVAMFLGFLIIISGAILAYKIAYEDPSATQVPSIVTSLSGVIVEFISATFLFIYRSTMRQASEYVDILRRLNTIGTSVKLVDEIGDKDSEPTFKNRTRAQIASQILSQPGLETEDKS